MVPSPNECSHNLEVGPPLTARQRKAAAAIGVCQILALAELRATAQEVLTEPRNRPHRAGADRKVSTTTGRAALTLLRACNAKRQAEDEAEAAASAAAAAMRPTTDHSRTSAAAAVTAVGRKPIAILPPLGAPPIPPGAASSLGCHLARRCGGGAGSKGTGHGGSSSSLARVYGGRLRSRELPEDYAECFVGLDPVPQRDPDEQGPVGAVQHPGSAAHPTGLVGVDAAAAAAVAAAGLAPTGSGLLGSLAGVGDGGLPFLFSPSAAAAVPPAGLATTSGDLPYPQPDFGNNTMMTLNPGADAAAAAVPTAAAVGGGLFVGAGDVAGAGTMGASGFMAPVQAPGLDGMPYVNGLPYGDTAAAAAGAGVLAGASVAGDLMLDDDDDAESSGEGDDDDVDMGLGDGIAGPSSQVRDYGGMAGAVAPGSAYEFGGAVGGYQAGGGGVGASGVVGTSAAGVMDEEAEVEEF